MLEATKGPEAVEGQEDSKKQSGKVERESQGQGCLPGESEKLLSMLACLCLLGHLAQDHS